MPPRHSPGCITLELGGMHFSAVSELLIHCLLVSHSCTDQTYADSPRMCIWKCEVPPLRMQVCIPLAAINSECSCLQLCVNALCCLLSSDELVPQSTMFSPMLPAVASPVSTPRRVLGFDYESTLRDTLAGDMAAVRVWMSLVPTEVGFRCDSRAIV